MDQAQKLRLNNAISYIAASLSFFLIISIFLAQFLFTTPITARHIDYLFSIYLMMGGFPFIFTYRTLKLRELRDIWGERSITGGCQGSRHSSSG